MTSRASITKFRSRLSVRTTGKAALEFLATQRRAKSLDGGASTNFTLTFKPRGKGARRASLTVISSSAPRSLPLSGAGEVTNSTMTTRINKSKKDFV